MFTHFTPTHKLKTHWVFHLVFAVSNIHVFVHPKMAQTRKKHVSEPMFRNWALHQGPWRPNNLPTLGPFRVSEGAQRTRPSQPPCNMFCSLRLCVESNTFKTSSMILLLQLDSSTFFNLRQSTSALASSVGKGGGVALQLGGAFLISCCGFSFSDGLLSRLLAGDLLLPKILLHLGTTLTRASSVGKVASPAD